jgi:hypothetical protein
LNSAPIGTVGLTGLPLNQFDTLTLSVPSNVLTALNQSFDDLRFSFVVTLPTGATGTYVLDNLRFTP